MSFDKFYPNRKDWRTPYRKAKAFDRSCRNHGSCSYCMSNRMHKHVKREVGSLDELDMRHYRNRLK